jgi:hypothetical protein
MTAIRVMLLVAGIVAVVALPTAEVNGTEGIVTAVSLPVAELNVTEGSPLGRRELVAPGEQVVELEEEDCPNFMWKLGKKGEMICDFGRAQEVGMLVCFGLNFLIFCIALGLSEDTRNYTNYVLITYVGVCCGYKTDYKPRSTWKNRECARPFIAFLGPFIFEINAVYILFELFYGIAEYLNYFPSKALGSSDGTTGDSTATVTGVAKAAKFNQGFPKIGPGDCRSSKYARVQTNAC